MEPRSGILLRLKSIAQSRKRVRSAASTTSACRSLHCNLASIARMWPALWWACLRKKRCGKICAHWKNQQIRNCCGKSKRFWPRLRMSNGRQEGRKTMIKRVDAHQHFWAYSPEEYGWIDGNMEEIRRDFLPPHLATEMAGAGISTSIAVQARQTVAETERLLLSQAPVQPQTHTSRPPYNRQTTQRSPTAPTDIRETIFELCVKKAP